MITGGIIGIATLTLATFRHSFLPRPKISPENPQKQTQAPLIHPSDNAVTAVIPEQKSQPPLRVPASLSKPTNVLHPPSRTPARYSAAPIKDAAAPFNKVRDAQYPLRRFPRLPVSQAWSTRKDSINPQPLPTQPSNPQLGHNLSLDASSNAATSRIPCENPGDENTANTPSESPKPREGSGNEGHIANNQPTDHTHIPPLSSITNSIYRESDPQMAPPRAQDQPITPDPLISNDSLTSTDIFDTNPCHLKQPAGKN